ncbi:hypothetical protein ACI7YQ_19905 (plasmid) [Alteromonas marina]
MEITCCFGKAVRANNGVEYGLVRAATKPYPAELFNYNVLAEDECGNYFIEFKSKIYFWDHEINEKTLISDSISEFRKSCFEPPEVALNTDDVVSVWINPEFAKEHGKKSES